MFGLERHTLPPPSRPENRERPKSTSLWQQAQGYLAVHGEALRTQQENPSLGKTYAESVVRGKIAACANNLDDCAEAYMARRRAANRDVDKRTKERLRKLTQGRLYEAQAKVVKKCTKQIKRLEIQQELGLAKHAATRLAELEEALVAEQQLLETMPRGQEAKDASDVILLEEASQEYALRALDKKTEAGALDPKALNAQIWLELELTPTPDLRVSSRVEGVMAVEKEVRSFVEKGYINAQEARTIIEYGERYADEFMAGFQKRFHEGTAQELYELLRDNARKVAYQTKLDKRTLAGSDHGARHIYEGNTHFAEQILSSLESVKGVDLKSRDKILIRQIIIDHDLGYTTPAAQSEGGEGAAKDHPCVGCRYIEANRPYYEQKFGTQGYDVIRDVLLNHSYPSSKYRKKRPEGPFTYNRALIRSVVSTVDSLSVTAETKAMDLFRYPETIRILQEARLYADAHNGVIDEGALAEFKQDLHTCTDTLVQEGRLSAERAKAYHSAIDQKFHARAVKKTLGQFTGIIANIRLVESEKDKGELVPEIGMNLSRLQSLVAELFGDNVSLEGFKKALESFGLPNEELKRLGKQAEKLRRENAPEKREKILKSLRFASDRAQFVIGIRETTGLRDEREDEHNAILTQFNTFRQESARDDINNVFDKITLLKKPRTPDAVKTLSNELKTVLDVADGEETDRLERIIQSLNQHLNDDDALDVLQDETKLLLSKHERGRLSGKFERSSSPPPEPR